MNQTQRKFLIDKISASGKLKIEAHKSSIPDYPDLQNYIYMMVMQGTYEVQTVDVIKEAIKKKALSAKDRSYNWLAEERSWGDLSARRKVTLNISDLLIFPPDYEAQIEAYRVARKSAEDKINEIHMQMDGLITRIQLASDKILEKMINEVDDLGELSFFDSTLQYITSSIEYQKQLK